MADNTSIVNMSLGRIKAPRISNLATDTQKEAVNARIFFDEARDDLLREGIWNFAVKRVKPTKASETPEFGFDNAFVLPSDNLRVISVHQSTDWRVNVTHYRIENMTVSGTDTDVIVTDWSEIYLRYVAQVTDANLMTPSFRELLSLRLARDLALALDHSHNVAEFWGKQYRQKLFRAKSVDGMEDVVPPMPAGSWHDSRFGDNGYMEGLWSTDD